MNDRTVLLGLWPLVSVWDEPERHHTLGAGAAPGPYAVSPCGANIPDSHRYHFAVVGKHDGSDVSGPAASAASPSNP